MNDDKCWLICRYIGTFYYRENIDFGVFKRDVLLFKNLSLFQLAFLIFRSIQNVSSAPFLKNLTDSVDFITLGMFCGGYGISILATIALGLDRTYFGSELGYCESKWVTDFPYG